MDVQVAPAVQPPPELDGVQLSPVRQLLRLIETSLDALEKSTAARGTPIPDLNAPFHPDSEAFRIGDPVAIEAANIISASALQLAAILMPPQVSLYSIVGGHFKSAAIRACIESNVTEILREAGPEGLHIDEITTKNGQDPKKLGRFLRFLATNHIYREIKPNVFTNTRISSMLDTFKSSQDLLANPETKHDNTLGLAALASHHLDETFKASAYAWETLDDPETVNSGEPDASPFARSIGTKETLWEWYERPENAFRHRRFNIAMHGVQALQPVDASLSAFDWKNLKDDAVVIDVGGGVGTSLIPIAREFPKLKLVLQDLPNVIKDAQNLWESTAPDALQSGRAVLEPHDFFTPQPERQVDVFLMKQILHDWSDEYCVKILKHLRAAASKNTKLVLMEVLIPFACHDTSGDGEGNRIPGGTPREAPEPLLANYGAVNALAYNADLCMFLLFNSQDRTVQHLDDLLSQTGWKVTIVHRAEGGTSMFAQSIEAVPI